MKTAARGTGWKKKPSEMSTMLSMAKLSIGQVALNSNFITAKIFRTATL